jgi:hypothetical protein
MSRYSGRRLMSRPMLADRLDRAHRIFVSEFRMMSSSLLFGAQGDVVERQNPLKHSVTIDDRQPPYLFVAHRLERGVYVFVQAEKTFREMTSPTGISEARRAFVVAAMAMSRSVAMPITLFSLSTTGSAPQSYSSIIAAASARLVSGRQDFTSRVITS